MMPKPTDIERVPLRFEYDPFTDVMTIEGVRYSGGLFRALGVGGLATDRWLKIVSREDGILTVFNAPEGTPSPCPDCRASGRATGGKGGDGGICLRCNGTRYIWTTAEANR